MSEELRTEPNAYFMTLTISDENYEILKNTCKSEDKNTTAAEYFYTQAQEKKVWEEVREQVVKADVAEDTKEAMIKRAGLENFNLMQAGIESITRQKLNNEQINYLKGQLAIGWANVAIGEKSVANEAAYRDWE